MKLSSISLLGLVAFMVGSVGFGQGPAVAPPLVKAKIDIYAHFVGTWVGTTRVLRQGAEVPVPVRVEVTEGPNREHLRFFFVYKEPGQTEPQYVTRVATLDPAKGEMTWVEADNPKAPDALQHTVGLEAFAQTGYGVFNTTYETGADGHHLTNRCMYVLNSDLFGYVWYESVDGKPFELYSVTQLTRENEQRASVTKP